MTFEGNQYAALDGTSPDSTSVGCQDYYLGLPVGWVIAPNTRASIQVTAMHPWGTYEMVLSDGSEYYTTGYYDGSMAGQPREWLCCSDGLTALGQNGDQYKVNACARRILIMKGSEMAAEVRGAMSNASSPCDITPKP